MGNCTSCQKKKRVYPKDEVFICRKRKTARSAPSNSAENTARKHSIKNNKRFQNKDRLFVVGEVNSFLEESPFPDQSNKKFKNCHPKSPVKITAFCISDNQKLNS